MLQQIAAFLVNVVAGFFVYLLLARFLFQWLRVPFRNVIGEFVIAATGWMVVPARRLIPSLAGLDLASLVLAWLLQALGLLAIYAIAGADLSHAAALASVAALAVLDLLRSGIHFFVFSLIVQAVLSWVNPHSPLQPLFDALTRPLLRPLRRILPPLANVDLSPLVMIVLLQVLLIPLATLRATAGAM